MNAIDIYPTVAGDTVSYVIFILNIIPSQESGNTGDIRRGNVCGDEARHIRGEGHGVTPVARAVTATVSLQPDFVSDIGLETGKAIRRGDIVY